MIAAAALLGSFGAAGTMNGLWATSDARAHSLDGVKLALGLPYGNTTPHKIQLSVSTAFADTNSTTCEGEVVAAVPHKNLVAEIFQRPHVHAIPRLVMAEAAPQVNGFSPVAAPAPAEPPVPPLPAEPPTAPASIAPAFAALSASLNSPGAVKSLMALAEADAGRSAKLASRAAEAAMAAEQAQAFAEVQIGLKGHIIVTQSQYESLEREFDQALARLEVSQALAARINESDPSFFVLRADGKKFCGTAQAGEACTLLSSTDIARIRSDVAAQIKLANNELRQVQAKLARARLSDG